MTEELIDQLTDQHIALSIKFLSQTWTSLEYQSIAFRRDVGSNISEPLNVCTDFKTLALSTKWY